MNYILSFVKCVQPGYCAVSLCKLFKKSHKVDDIEENMMGVDEGGWRRLSSGSTRRLLLVV